MNAARVARRAASSIVPRTADVVVIGSGIIGSSTALELARSGKFGRVLVLDKGGAAGGGSTSSSSGVCRPFYSVEDAVRFAHEGYHIWDEWEDHLGVTRDSRGMAQLRQIGGVVLVSDASESFVTQSAACMEAVGVEHEWLDLAQTKRRFGAPPAEGGLGWCLDAFAPPRLLDDPDFGCVSPTGDAVRGALWVPECGYVSDPQLAAQNLMRAAELSGAEFVFGAEVAAIHRSPDGARVAGLALADGSTIEAPVVINVGGPDSAFVTSLAFPHGGPGIGNDMRVQTRPLRVEVAIVPSPPDVDYAAHGPMVADFDCGVYWRPEVGNRILIGSVEPECDEPHPFVDLPMRAGDVDLALTDQWTVQVHRTALRMPGLPIPGASATQGLVACYDASDDWTPIYDKSCLHGYYMAIGTSGNQFKNAGVAGQLMAAIIAECEEGRDHDVAPVQLPMRRTGTGTMDSSIFSRLRTSHSTSGTVMG